MSEKPSLQEIAAMPLPASLEAMRKHYNPDWGKDIGDGSKKTFRCKVDYEIRGSETVDIEAFTADEAYDKAAEKVEQELEGGCDFGDINIDHVAVKEIAA